MRGAGGDGGGTKGRELQTTGQRDGTGGKGNVEKHLVLEESVSSGLLDVAVGGGVGGVHMPTGKFKRHCRGWIGGRNWTMTKSPGVGQRHGGRAAGEGLERRGQGIWGRGPRIRPAAMELGAPWGTEFESSGGDPRLWGPWGSGQAPAFSEARGPKGGPIRKQIFGPLVPPPLGENISPQPLSGN